MNEQLRCIEKDKFVYLYTQGAGIGFVSGVAISLATYIGRRVVGKPAFLTRKLSVSTSLCPAGCSYLDSINATSMISRNEMGFTTAQPESTPYAEEYDLSFIENYLSISYLLIPVLGLIISILVGVGVSLLTGEWRIQMSRRLLRFLTCATCHCRWMESSASCGKIYH